MERRILGRLRGDATEEFHASLGYMDLQVSSPFLYKQRLPNSETGQAKVEELVAKFEALYWFCTLIVATGQVAIKVELSCV